MGGKTSRPTVGTDVYYTVDSRESMEPIQKLTKKLMKGSPFSLKPLQPGTQGGISSEGVGGGWGPPVLIFKECSHPSIHLTGLMLESHNLHPNELMVVLTSEVMSRNSDTSEALVQLQVKTKGKNKSIDSSLEVNKRNIDAIASFLAKGGRETPNRCYQESNTGMNSPYVILPSSSTTSSITAATTAAAAEGEEEAGSASRGTSATASPVPCPVVHMAFGDAPDDLLRDSVRFVETECQVRLVESTDVLRSHPLLVVCKNSSQLQEDIRHATENTRAGSDVMLLVITDRKDLVLVDTEATEPLGAKGCLLYDQLRAKFSFTDNRDTLKWIKKFLARHSIEIHLKLNRTDSLRQSLSKWRKSEESGWYVVLGGLSEEKKKNAVLFFDNLHVVLTETEHVHPAPPLVVLCRANQEPDRKFLTYRNQHPDIRDAAFLVIVHRTSEEVPDFRALQDIEHGKLATGDLSAHVEDSPQNKRLAEAIRKFLKKNTVPSQRGKAPVAREKDTTAMDYGVAESSEGAGSPSALCVSSPTAGGGSVKNDSLPVEGEGEDDGDNVVAMKNMDSSAGDVLIEYASSVFGLMEVYEREPSISVQSREHAPQTVVTQPASFAQDKPPLVAPRTVLDDRPVPRKEQTSHRSSSIQQHPSHNHQTPPLPQFRDPHPLQPHPHPPPPHPPHPHNHPHHSRQSSTHSSTFSQVSLESSRHQSHQHQVQQQQHGNRPPSPQSAGFVGAVDVGIDDDGGFGDGYGGSGRGGGGGEDGRREASFPAYTAAGERVSVAPSAWPRGSSSSSTRGSWSKRKRHPRQAVHQVFSPGTNPSVSHPGDGFSSPPSVPLTTTTTTESATRRERSGKRRVEDSTADDGGDDLALIFEGLSINRTKRRKSAPYTQRRTDKAHAQREALWLKTRLKDTSATMDVT